MSPRKHLVLDEDVHEALSQRRELTGLPISQMGNAILRSHIASALQEQLLGEQLIRMGHLSQEEYQAALEQVDRRMRSEFEPGAPPLESPEKGRFFSGSWEIVNLFESPVGAFQLLEAWARDDLRRPMVQHTHAAEEYLIALKGRCLVVMSGTPFTLTKDCSLRIPAGVTHSATPLDGESHILVIASPLIPEYSS